MSLVYSVFILSLAFPPLALSAVASSSLINSLPIPAVSANTTPLAVPTTLLVHLKQTEYGYVAGNGQYSILPSSLQGTGTPLQPYSMPWTGARVTPPAQTSVAAAKSYSMATEATTDCPVSCQHNIVPSSFLYWSPVSVTKTVTAETIMYLINHNLNTTRTTTITNTEIDLSESTMITNTNSAGTQTTTVAITDGSGSVTTHTLTFPTPLSAEYPYSYTWCGTLSSTINGSGTCVRSPCNAPTGHAVFAFPSHPPISRWSVQTTLDGYIPGSDPKGLFYEPAWEYEAQDACVVPPCSSEWGLEHLFPGLGVWSCDTPPPESPDTVKMTALYMTATSTSIESGDATVSPSFSEPPVKPNNKVGTSDLSTRPSVSVIMQPSTLSKATEVASQSPGLTRTDKSALKSSSGSASAHPAPTEQQGDTVPSSAEIPPAILASMNMLSYSNALISPIEPSIARSNKATSVAIDSHPVSTASTPITYAAGVASISEAATSKEESSTRVPASDQMIAMDNIQTSSIATTIDSPITPSASVLGDQTGITDSQDQHNFEDQTLVSGAPTTLDTGTAPTPVLSQSSNSDTKSSASLAATGPQPITIGTETPTATTEDQFTVGSQTLTPSKKATISGTSSFLASSDIASISGTSSSLAPIATQIDVGTSTQGIGGYIISGMGGQPSAYSTEAAVFKGFGAQRMTIWDSDMLVLVLIVVLAVAI